MQHERDPLSLEEVQDNKTQECRNQKSSSKNCHSQKIKRSVKDRVRKTGTVYPGQQVRLMHR